MRRPFPSVEALRPEGREGGSAEGDNKKDHARSARLADIRHHAPPQLVKRRRVAQRDQQEENADAAQPPNKAPPLPSKPKTENRKRDHRQAEILGVEFEPVRAP